jgi:hypothetical protein
LSQLGREETLLPPNFSTTQGMFLREGVAPEFFPGEITARCPVCRALQLFAPKSQCP